jgi:hypothetical protein
MSDLEELERRIQNLPIEELSKFRAWLIEFGHLVWDQQIGEDSRAGKLRELVAEARADYQAGKT